MTTTPISGPAHIIVGAPREASCRRTVQVIQTKLAGLSALEGERMLDAGCGDGTFTRALSGGFREVYGIDVQEEWLQRFRTKNQGDRRFTVLNMSASELQFPDAFFDLIVSIETIEHIPDLLGAVRQFHRVLKPGGECLITCPNRLFPFENHGIRIGDREIARRIPLLPYLPPLHDKLSLARVFTVRVLDRLFGPVGLDRVGLDYAWPTFEHGGNPFQPLLKPLFGLMRLLERSPLRLFGSSIIVKYVKRP